MTTQFIGDGLVIEHDGSVFEYHQRAGSTLYFQEVTTGKLLPIGQEEFYVQRASGDLVVLGALSTNTELKTQEQDDESTKGDFCAYPEKVQEKALRVRSYVIAMQLQKIGRGQLTLIADAIHEVSEDIGDKSPPSPRTVSRWMAKFQSAAADPITAIDGRATARRPRRLPTETEALISRAIDSEYLTLTRKTIAEAYLTYKIDLLAENQRRQAYKLPSLAMASKRTFYRRIDALNKYEVAEARFGRNYARAAFRLKRGDLPADGPLDYAEMDSTLLDLYVLDDDLCLPLGRPTFYVVKDRYSSLVMGLYATFSGASAEGALAAIANCFKPRKLIRERFPDIRGEWPIAGPATTYVTDNGPDFQSLAFRRGIAALGSIQQFCAVRTPWHKPGVESFFRVINATLLESLPGKTFSNVLQRHGYDPRRDAVVRFSTFVKLIYKWAIEQHNQSPHSRKNRTPYQLWTEGMVGRPIPLPPTPRDLVSSDTRN